MIKYLLKKLSLDKYYMLLIYLIFILSFLSLWSSDNINIKTREHFDSPECPKKYLDKLLEIAKSKGKINGNIHDIDTKYELNEIDIRTKKSGSMTKSGKFPKESNYNFSIKSKDKDNDNDNKDNDNKDND